MLVVPLSPVLAEAGMRATHQREDPSEADGSPGRNQKLLILGVKVLLLFVVGKIETIPADRG